MDEPVNILTHEFFPFRGGIGVYVQEIAEAFSARGKATTVWAPDYGTSHTDNHSYRVRRIPMRGKQDWACRLRLARAVRRAFPGGSIPGTLVLAEPGPIRLWMYRRWLGLPKPDRLVIVFHGTELKKLSESSYRRILLDRLMRDSDCVGVVSDAIRETLLRTYSAHGDKVARVPGAVRSSWSGMAPAPISLGSGKNEILQVGRIHPRKGQEVLVEAIARLPEALRKQIQVRLVGPVGQKAYADRVTARIKASALPVRIEGSLPEEALKAAYESASVVVMPSQPYRDSIEGLGLALLEAQHFGRPVIGSRIGGIMEALKENETGLLVPPGDADALANALEALLLDPVRAQSMGEAGAHFVRSQFSWDANVGKLDREKQLT